MCPARAPSEVLRTKGSAIKNPKLFKDRRDPKADKLGPPSDWMDADTIAAWHAFAREIPWLMESDRVHLEIACSIRGRLMAGKEVGIGALNLLRLAAGQMGANPADRSRIKTGDDTDDASDPTAGYFQ
jgi:hypothetical protein